MSPELRKQIETEFAKLHQLLELHHALLSKCLEHEPTVDEVPALAAILHSFYTGIENLLKRTAMQLDRSVPRGEFSHALLLRQMRSATQHRPAIVSEQLYATLQEYMLFRHVFRHAYSFDLQWTKMEHLVNNAGAVLQQLESELHTLLKVIDSGSQ